MEIVSPFSLSAKTELTSVKAKLAQAFDKKYKYLEQACLRVDTQEISDLFELSHVHELSSQASACAMLVKSFKSEYLNVAVS